MRRVILSDVMVAAQALGAVPRLAKGAVAAAWVAEAHAADKYTRRTGHRHPDWGDGTLSARVSAVPCGRQDRRTVALADIGLMIEIVSRAAHVRRNGTVL